VLEAMMKPAPLEEPTQWITSRPAWERLGIVTAGPLARSGATWGFVRANSLFVDVAMIVPEFGRAMPEAVRWLQGRGATRVRYEVYEPTAVFEDEP
jgi:hypothetical protein